MEDMEILARELWIVCNGDGADPEYWRREWGSKEMEMGRAFWIHEAAKLRLALAGDGLFVVRGCDA